MSDQRYFVVGVHGAPTPETAPHGFAFRRPGHRWTFGYLPVAINVDAEWYPLPAPPTEEAPAPEPVERWVAQRDRGTGGGRLWTRDGAPSLRMIEEVAEDLNTLEADGVVYGPGRPMSELPDVGLVLVQMSSGVPYTFYVRKADYIATHRNTYDCWWPLPLPGEAQ